MMKTTRTLLVFAVAMLIATMAHAQCGFQFLGKSGDVIYYGWEASPYSSNPDSTIIIDSLLVLSDSTDESGTRYWQTRRGSFVARYTQFNDGLVVSEPGGVVLHACEREGIWRVDSNKFVTYSLGTSQQRIFRQSVVARGVLFGSGDTTAQSFEPNEVRYFVDKLGFTLIQETHQLSDRLRVVGGFIMGNPIGFLPTSVDDIQKPTLIKESFLSTWQFAVPDGYEGGICEVFDIAGTRVRLIEMSDQIVSIVDLPSGIYLSKVTDSSNRKPMRLSVVHFFQ